MRTWGSSARGNGAEGIQAFPESALARRVTVAGYVVESPLSYTLGDTCTKRFSAALPTAADRSSIRDMQTTPRTKPHRDIARLAIWAALIAVTLPLLPLYGDGSGPFIFSSALPLRYLISFLLVWWANAVVVAVGILYLRQDRVGVAGGLFLAAALTVAIAIIEQVLQTAPHFGRWQTDLVLVLEIIEGGLLALAAVRAIGARSA